MSIGYELEFLGADLPELSKKYQLPLYHKFDIVSYEYFHLKPEDDVTEQMKGGELISPVYYSEDIMLQELKQQLEILKESKAYIPKNSDGVGFHISLGNEFFDNRTKFEQMLKLLFAFQAEIFDFAKGEHETIRNNYMESARPLDYDWVRHCIQRYSYLPYLSKLHCIRFKPDIFELRYFSSSLCYETLRRFLEFVLQFAQKIECENYDKELIDYYFDHWYDLGVGPKKERKAALCKLLDFKY